MTTTPTANHRQIHRDYLAARLTMLGVAPKKRDRLVQAYLYAVFDGEAFRTPAESEPLLSLVRTSLRQVGFDLDEMHSQVMYGPLLLEAQNEWSK